MKNLIDFYLKNIVGRAEVKKPLEVVVDCSNGASGAVFGRLRIPQAKILLINSKVDGNFPAHGPNPLEKGALDDLRREILRRRADFGVAFDGDGDRVFFVDNKGRYLPSYIIAYLLSLVHKPPFVADVFTFKSIEYLGFLKNRKICQSRVGYYFMKQVAEKHKASFGAEWSNHYLFKETYYADSGLLAVIKIMNVLSFLPYSLADFYDFAAPDFRGEQFNVRAKNPAAIMRKTRKIFGKKASSVEKIDGWTFNFSGRGGSASSGDGWFLIVRPSNTEPLVRFFIGAKKNEFNALRKEVIKRLGI